MIEKMPFRRAIIGFSILNFLAWPRTSFSQKKGTEDQHRAKIFELAAPLINAIDSAESAFSPIVETLKQIRIQLTSLDSNLRLGVVTSSVDLEELFFDYKQDFRAIAKEPSSENSKMLAKNVLDDIQAKNRYIASSANLIGDEKSIRIKVEVQTFSRANGKLIDGFSVTSTPRRLFSTGRSIFYFSDSTNHATRFLLPGEYVFTVTNGQGILKNETAAVGMNGEKSEIKKILID